GKYDCLGSILAFEITKLNLVNEVDIPVVFDDIGKRQAQIQFLQGLEILSNRLAVTVSPKSLVICAIWLAAAMLVVSKL
ncbi:MAG: hypothetical protein ACI9HG_002005, partial [Flavobacteriales bacterium]